MGLEIWVAIIALIIIGILLNANKDKKDEIEYLKRNKEWEKEQTDTEIRNLKQAIENGENLLRSTAQKDSKEIQNLRLEIAKQIEISRAEIKNSQEKYDEIYQKYIKLVRAYMVARKKSEIDIINEIEKSISVDYEQLGSKNIPVTSYIASAMADFYTANIKESEKMLLWMGQRHRSDRIGDVRADAELIIRRSKNCQYAYESALSRVLKDHPEIDKEYIIKHYGISLTAIESGSRYDDEDISKLLRKNQELEAKCNELETLVRSCEEFKDMRWPLLKDSILEYKKEFSSNLTAIPYMSRIIADIMTIDLDRLAWSLSWGNNQERKKKVASLIALKKEKAEEIEKIKGAEYQLSYLLELYPTLQEVIDAEFKELDISFEQITEYDPVMRYVEHEEWEKYSEAERNQLALDRYVESRKKSKWQIGRDYELYCGYCYEKQGYKVDYYGSFHGVEDLGRDLILKKGKEVKIVQCKYWSKTKQIHENHIMQLYGSVIEYNLENNQTASGILITNIVLSEKAKQFAEVLGIAYEENVPLGEFPRIKCNIGSGEFGEKTKIYHLPFDQQYDSTKIDKRDEFMALTVAEAEEAGFRRAYRWHGTE